MTDIRETFTVDVQGADSLSNLAGTMRQTGEAAQLTSAQIKELFNASAADRGALLESFQQAKQGAQELGDKLQEAKGKADDAGSSFSDMVAKGAEMATGFLAAKVSIEGIADALKAAISGYQDWGNSITNLQNTLGVPIEVANAWKESEAVTGQSAEGIVAKLSMLETRLTQGTPLAVNAFELIFKNMSTTVNDFLVADPGQQIQLLAQAMQTSGLSAQEFAVAMKELGGRGALGLIAEIQPEAQALQKDIKGIGDATDDAVKAAREWKIATAELWAEWDHVAHSAGNALLQMISGGAKGGPSSDPFQQLDETLGGGAQPDLGFGTLNSQLLASLKQGQAQDRAKNEAANEAAQKNLDEYQKKDAAEALKRAKEELAEASQRLTLQLKAESEAVKVQNDLYKDGSQVEKMFADLQAKDSSPLDAAIQKNKDRADAEIERIRNVKASTDAEIAFQQLLIAGVQLWQQDADGAARDADARKKFDEATKLQDLDMLKSAETQKALDQAAGDTGAVIQDKLQIAIIRLQEEFRKGDMTIDEFNARLRELQQTASDESFLNTFKELDSVFKSIGSIATSFGAGGIGKAFSTIGSDVGGIGKDWNAFSAGLSGLGKEGGFNLSNLGGMLSGAAGLASIGVSIFETIKSMFSKPEYEKDMEDVGEHWGVSISEGLGKKIESTENKDHVSRFMAELLNISDIMSEGGGDPGQYWNHINDLMQAMADKAVPAKDAVDQLNKAFTDLQTSAAAGSIQSEQAMIQMEQRATQLKETIPDMQKFIQSSLTAGGTGFGDFFKAQQGTVSGGQAIADQQLLGIMFQAQTAQFGAVVAAQNLTTAFDEMEKHLPKGSPIPPEMRDAAQMLSLLKDKGFAAAASGATGLSKGVGALIDTGNLSQTLTNAAELSTEGLYGQAMKAKGATEQTGLEAILPALTKLAQAQALGMKLDPTAAHMLADAQKDNLLPALDTATQQLVELRGIRAGIAGLRGSFSGSGGYTAGEAGTYTSGDSVGGSYGTPPGPPPIRAATGLSPIRLSTDTLIQAHAGELAMIIPESMSTNMAYVSAAFGLYNQDTGDPSGVPIGSARPGYVPGPGLATGEAGAAGGTVSGIGTPVGAAVDLATHALAAATSTMRSISMGLDNMTMVVASLATRPAASLTINAVPQITVNQDPLRTRESQEAVQRQSVQGIETALRMGIGTLPATLKNALLTMGFRTVQG